MTSTQQTVTLVAAEHFREGLKAYDVLLDGEKIGSVEQYYPTFERSAHGSRIVSKRWTTKRARWAPHAAGIRNGFRLWKETRKAAIEQVVRAYEYEIANKQI